MERQRILELEIAALRTLLPRLILAWTAEHLEERLLDERSVSDAIAPIARDEGERAFLINYTGGMLRDMRALVRSASAAVGAAERPTDQLVALGDDALRRRDHASALAHFDEAIAREPDHFVLLHRRGVALQQLGRAAEALAAFDCALRPGTKGSSPLYVGALRAVRSNCLLASDRFIEALADSEIAIGLCPNAPEPLVARARALMLLGRGSESVDVYDDILERADELLFDEGISVADVAREREAAASALLSAGVEQEAPQ